VGSYLPAQGCGQLPCLPICLPTRLGGQLSLLRDCLPAYLPTHQPAGQGGQLNLLLTCPPTCLHTYLPIYHTVQYRSYRAVPTVPYLPTCLPTVSTCCAYGAYLPTYRATQPLTDCAFLPCLPTVFTLPIYLPTYRAYVPTLPTYIPCLSTSHVPYLPTYHVYVPCLYVSMSLRPLAEKPDNSVSKVLDCISYRFIENIPWTVY